ncbi:CIR protein, partial [Plasmodium chabaudi adami]
MSAHVCEIFDNLYTQFPDDDDEVHRTNGKSLLYETFCPKNGDEHQKCSTDLDRISAGFGYLVLQLFDNVDFEEDHEDQKGNYVYYGLLWASDKLQQSNKKNNTSIGLYDFFNDYIINGEWYGEIKEHVEPKMNLLNKEIDIDMMKDIYSIFKDMCKIFSNNDDDIDNINFMSYYDSVKSCGENILKKNSNHVNRDTSGSSCLSLYYVLKNIYNDFKNDCIAIMNPPTTALPDIPSIEEIKKTLESNSEKLDSQDCGSENSDCVEKCELTIPENELEQPQNDKTVEKLLDIEIKEEICFENLKPELPKIDPELEKFEIEFASFETKLPKFETELPDVLGELEVIDIETDEKVLLDELEFSNIEVEYPDAQDYFFDIDTDLSFFEDKYSDLENDPQNIVDALFVSENSIPNIVDELYVPEDDLSYPMVKPKIIDFEWPDLNIEENDSDNQSQPHQTNTLEFDDPFKNPEK